MNALLLFSILERLINHHFSIYTTTMKVIVKIKLTTTQEQKDALYRTIELANDACNYLSERAWTSGVFRQYDLHKLAYYDTRDEFPDLSSQVVVRAIAKVADAYKLDNDTKRVFRSLGAIAYDDKILRFYTDRQMVSIWSVDGRLKIPYQCGSRGELLLKTAQGQAELIYRDGEFYLHQACNIETPDPYTPEGWLGVDLGVVNIAATSDGEMFSGEVIESRRVWYAKRRRILQSVGTKSAKRKLRKMSGRQSRFQSDVNHCISKALVAKARRHNLGIALEDLKGITKRTTVRKAQRARHHNWGFFQLKQYTSYKAKIFGVPLHLVDPRYTSQTCPECGHISKSNRPTRDSFCCEQCGFSGLADHVAAINIAARAAVNQPMVSPRRFEKASTVGRDKLPVSTGSN